MKPGVSIKGQIKKRSWGSFFVMLVLGLLILYKAFLLQTVQRDELLKSLDRPLISERTIKATRGNIYAADGKSLLATSVPIYTLGMDPKQAKNELFEENIDSLALMLSQFFGDKSKAAYKEKITKARFNKKSRYVALGGRFITHDEREIIKNFPLFRAGQHKGGVKFDRKEYRMLPFENLASRTVGKLDKDTQTRGDFGVEFSFNNYLSGKDGKGYFKRLPGNVYMPIESGDEVETVPGQDVVTTLDVNYQDIVESALRNQVVESNANYGSAVVMEIATGEIKAIANLTKRERNGQITYLEDMNYAVLGGTDPGSTFKLASMMAILEEGNLSLNDLAVNCEGSIIHAGKAFTCSHAHGNLTVQEVFEKSCNIGVYELVRKVFGFNRMEDFLVYMHKFRLDQPVGFQLKGEIKPYLKNTADKSFSRLTFPWMSIGYESKITPLQMLSFYNAVANDGYWVQPIIVKEIKQANTVVQKFEANKLQGRFASENSIEMAKIMMEGVAERGTAQKIKEGYCKIAGKTGTAQKRTSEGYKAGRYYTSFVGYFPANNPKYSCIVVIDEPRNGQLYGGDVCAPVFRSIADKVFAYDVKIHPAQAPKTNIHQLVKNMRTGHAEDLMNLADKFDIQNQLAVNGIVKKSETGNGWKKIKENTPLPDVVGMTLKDALPLLENKGFAVKHTGLGKVSNYSIAENKTIWLTLN